MGLGYELKVMHPAMKRYLLKRYNENEIDHHYCLKSGRIIDFLVVPSIQYGYLIECKTSCEEMQRSLDQVLAYTEEFRSYTGIDRIVPFLAIPAKQWTNKAYGLCVSAEVCPLGIDCEKELQL